MTTDEERVPVERTIAPIVRTAKPKASQPQTLIFTATDEDRSLVQGNTSDIAEQLKGAIIAFLDSDDSTKRMRTVLLDFGEQSIARWIELASSFTMDVLTIAGNAYEAASRELSKIPTVRSEKAVTLLMKSKGWHALVTKYLRDLSQPRKVLQLAVLKRIAILWLSSGNLYFVPEQIGDYSSFDGSLHQLYFNSIVTQQQHVETLWPAMYSEYPRNPADFVLCKALVLPIRFRTGETPRSPAPRSEEMSRIISSRLSSHDRVTTSTSSSAAFSPPQMRAFAFSTPAIANSRQTDVLLSAVPSVHKRTVVPAQQTTTRAALNDMIAREASRVHTSASHETLADSLSPARRLAKSSAVAARTFDQATPVGLVLKNRPDGSPGVVVSDIVKGSQADLKRQKNPDKDMVNQVLLYVNNTDVSGWTADRVSSLLKDTTGKKKIKYTDTSTFDSATSSEI